MSKTDTAPAFHEFLILIQISFALLEYFPFKLENLDMEFSASQNISCNLCRVRQVSSEEGLGHFTTLQMNGVFQYNRSLGDLAGDTRV